jgi:dethiobiotin synthetase
MNGYFVTGTDTNVGKTYVTTALAVRGRAQGLHVFAFKPIESGCSPGPTGEPVGADQEELARAAGDWQRGSLRGLYRLRLPAAPLVAAEAEGVSVDLARVVDHARQGASCFGASFTLVEGVGGWRVPITRDEDVSALARRLALPVIVVARAGLGTINHSLLTVEAVERAGLSVASLVLSHRPSEDPLVTASNREQILWRWPGRVVILGDDAAVLDDLVPRRL